jgi:PTS system beta-glucosides-specific IIC component
MGLFDFRKKANPIVSPLSGKVVPLSEVEDQAFSSGVMGKGLAILPDEGKLFSPVNGTIDSVTETKHAVSIVSDAGEEVLIHIGMDTVTLKGAPFTAHVADGQKIKSGDLLIEFDMAAIEAANLSTVTPIVVVNSDDYSSVTITEAGSVKVGEEIITAKK